MLIFIGVENDKGLDSLIDNRFGRAEYFLIYNQAKESILSIEKNPFKNDAQGVGIRVATMAVEKGCKAAIGAQPGPKAADVLAKAQIKIFSVENKTAREALEKFKTQLTG